MKWLMISLALAAGGLVRTHAEVAGDGLPEFFRAWLATQKRAGDVRVEFELTKTLPALKEPVKMPGRFWNYADGRFLWETGRPATSLLRFDGVSLYSWEAAENQWRTLDPNERSMRLWMGFLSGQNLTEQNLAKDFLVTVPATEKPLARIHLQPRSKRERRDLAQIELLFNLAGPRLAQVVVRQGDGGSQQMDFKQPKPMTAVDRTVVPPPATKTVPNKSGG